MSILLGIGVIILLVAILSFKPQAHGMKYCEYCERLVKPVKGWSWVGFIFGFGILYLIYYLVKSTHCPICHADNLHNHEPYKTESKDFVIPSLHD